MGFPQTNEPILNKEPHEFGASVNHIVSNFDRHALDPRQNGCNYVTAEFCRHTGDCTACHIKHAVALNLRSYTHTETNLYI